MGKLSKTVQSANRKEDLANALLEEVYTELRTLASARMAREAPNQTLQPTALVHEAWLRLQGPNKNWANKKHFFAAAAEAMRRILIDRARRKQRARHGANKEHCPLDEVTVASEDPDETVMAIHELIEQLAERDHLKAEIVKLRYFVGLNQPEIAEALNLSEKTVQRHWRYARSWLYATMNAENHTLFPDPGTKNPPKT